MSAPSEAYSELASARDLSARLAVEPNRPLPARAAAPGFVTFAAIPSRPTESASPKAVPVIRPEGIHDWDELLRWGLEACEATAVFVLDSQGFVIATVGAWEYDRVEATGTQLSVALEHADHVAPAEGRCQFLCLRAGELWVTAWRVPPDSGDPVMVAVISPAPLSEARSQALLAQVVASLPHL